MNRLQEDEIIHDILEEPDEAKGDDIPMSRGLRIITIISLIIVLAVFVMIIFFS